MWGFYKSRSIKNIAPQHHEDGVTRRRRVLAWTERILAGLGLALLLFYAAARIEGWLTSRAALKDLTTAHSSADVQADGGEVNPASDGGQDFANQLELPDISFSLWGERRIEAYKHAAAKQSGVPLAVLRIPKIRLEAPLFDGTDELTLNHGVGRIRGTAYPGDLGNIGIAGHRDGFFRGLKDVGVGDGIDLKTRKGTSTYIVEQIQIVSPRQVEVLRPTPVPSLTLVTCYPFYFIGSAPQRYIVTASLSSEKDAPEKIGEPETSSLSAPAIVVNSTRRKQMNFFKKASLMNKGAGAIVLVLLAFGTAAAQDSTVTTITHGEPSFETKVKNAEIVYVEGNDLVLKLENGRVEHLIVPDSDKFTIDGRELSVNELVPGTKLTQTLITSTTPRYVNSVRTIEGKVWHVNAPNSLILTLPDNKNQVFNVPSHAKFTIDGKEKTVFDLKKGMKINATIVTDEEHTVVEQTKLAYGNAPQISTPREVGVLLFLPMQHPESTLATAEQPADTLPETGSSLPLIGLLGTLAVGMSVAIRFGRRGFAL
jgi:sortase A